MSFKDPSVIAAIVSAVAAWIATWFSFRSAGTTRKMYGIAKAQQEGRQPHIVPYLVDGYVRRITNGRVYAFSLSVSNKSDNDNSLSRLELVISYRKGINPPSNIALLHDADLTMHLPDSTVKAFSIPALLPAHQTAAGSALFELPDTILKGASIERYLITLTDTHDLISSVEPIIIQEIIDD